MTVYCVTEICTVFLKKEAIWMGADFAVKPMKLLALMVRFHMCKLLVP